MLELSSDGVIVKLIFGDAEHVLWNEDVRVSKDPSFALLLFAHSGGRRDGRLGMLFRSRAFLVACIRQLGSAWYVGLGQMRDTKNLYEAGSQSEGRLRLSGYDMRATADRLCCNDNT